MTTKSPGKAETAARPTAGPQTQDMQTAYLVHTLAQMLYGQLATVNPWLAAAPYMVPPYAAPTTPYPTQASPYAMPNMPFEMPGMAYGMPNTPYTVPSTPYPTTGFVPQPMFGPQFPNWNAFYSTISGRKTNVER